MQDDSHAALQSTCNLYNEDFFTMREVKTILIFANETLSVRLSSEWS